jgi:hypothetical protein
MTAEQDYPMENSSRRTRGAAIWAVVMGLLIGACAYNPPNYQNTNPGKNLGHPEWSPRVLPTASADPTPLRQDAQQFIDPRSWQYGAFYIAGAAGETAPEIGLGDTVHVATVEATGRRTVDTLYAAGQNCVFLTRTAATDSALLYRRHSNGSCTAQPSDHIRTLPVLRLSPARVSGTVPAISRWHSIAEEPWMVLGTSCERD